MKQVIVYQESGKCCACPANNGIWMWGNEILVGFSITKFRDCVRPAQSDREAPGRPGLARSYDAGETWHFENPNYGSKPIPVFAGPESDMEETSGPSVVGNTPKTDMDPPERTERQSTLPLKEGVDFEHPDLAIRCGSDTFNFSYDRGKSWFGAVEFPHFGIGERLTSRTDYLIEGPKQALFGLSARNRNVLSKLGDRAFMARTRDGGKTFEFLSWVEAKEKRPRSVMPATIRLSENTLITTLRRRWDEPRNGAVYKEGFIDAYRSNDNGHSWTFLSKVTNTETPQQWMNGNPPALVQLQDGRLAVTFGYRSYPYGIKARISEDEGKTWGDDIMLRDDARLWDIGYTRSVVRPDGKVFTTYFFTTEDHPEDFIGGTIWDPSEF